MRERNHLQDTGTNRRIILKWIFGNWEEAWTGLTSLRRERQVVGPCEYGNELSGPIKFEEFLD
jgi:hypothetical protein